MPRGVFFRGDDRKVWRIFDEGFSARDDEKLRSESVMRFGKDPRTGAEKTNVAPDVHPGKVVCVTRDFYAAAVFPTDLSLLTNIFYLDLDTASLLNTQSYQWKYVQSIAHELATDAEKRAALWPMYGQERAAMRVEPHQILCAIQIERKWYGPSVFNGGKFRVRPDRTMVNSEVERDFLGEQFLEQAQRHIASLDPGKWYEIPTQAQGIAPSTGL